MRILVIDYLTYLGHRNFNKIHIESLLKTGIDMHVIGRRQAMSLIEPSDRLKVSFLPEWASKSFPLKSLSERIKNVAELYWIKRNFDIEQYDAIVFLAYDVLSLCTFRTNRPTFVINHNNVSQLKNIMKLCLTRRLPLNYKHIVLSKDSEEELIRLIPKRSVNFVPHGFLRDNGVTIKPLYLKEDEKFLFCPVNGNYDVDFVKSLFSSTQILNFLSDNNIKLVAKEKLFVNSQNCQIISIKGRIPEEEYRYYLGNALAVILPYSKDFKYRCSGILYECISVNTPVIASQIETLDMYRDLIQIKFFRNVSEFIDNIQYFLNSTRSKVDNTIFVPDNYWEQILKAINANVYNL